MSAFTAAPTQWKHMPEMLSAANPQAESRRQQDRAAEQWFTSKFTGMIFGHPDQTLGGMVKQRAKPRLDKRFGTKPQEVLNSPQAVAGGMRKAHIRGGHSRGRFGGVAKAHRPPTKAGNR